MQSQSTDDPAAGGYRLTPPTGVAYERMRRARGTRFYAPIRARLGRHALALAVVAFVAGQQWLAATAPVGGAPVLLVAPWFGLVATAVLACTAAVLAGAAVARRRFEPMTERTALRVLAVEDAATALGYGTGAGCVLLAVALPTVGVGPSVAAGSAGLGPLAVGAAAAALACRAAGWWLDGRVPGE